MQTCMFCFPCCYLSLLLLLANTETTGCLYKCLFASEENTSSLATDISEGKKQKLSLRAYRTLSTGSRGNTGTDVKVSVQLDILAIGFATGV